MNNVRCVGLDVHELSITIAVADPDGSAPSVIRRIPHDLNTLVKALRDLSARAKLKVAYEAGSVGFGLRNKLEKAGFECLVVAPSRVPTQGRQKTDAEDAQRLARFLRSGDLKGIYVPSKDVEGLRAITRAREDALKAQQMVRGQLRQFLIREGFRYEGKTAWLKAHLEWIRGLKFDHAFKAVVRDDYLREVELVATRVARLTAAVHSAAEVSPMLPLMKALQSLRGVQVVTAATVAAEIGDFRRFAKAKHFMSYLGLVPREASSGEREWRGSITKAGNSHMRRVLSEAAWHYRHSTRASAAINKRRKDVMPSVQEIAHKAEDRLHHRWRQMTFRKKEANKVNIAIARELAGFIWAVAQQVPTPA